MPNRRFFLTGLLLGTLFILKTEWTSAGERLLIIESLAPKAPSVYPGILWVKFDNLNYAHLDLGQLLAESVLIIDDQSTQRVNAYWGGAYNIAPGSSWNGCIQFEDYVPKITPGSHTIALKFGGETSNRETLRWSEPRSSVTLSADDWLHDTQQVARVIKPGLPRSCVEIWLPQEDGGLQGPEATRYYLHHGVKVAVPYDPKPAPDNAQNQVNGPVKVYLEDRIED